MDAAVTSAIGFELETHLARRTELGFERRDRILFSEPKRDQYRTARSKFRISIRHWFYFS